MKNLIIHDKFDDVIALYRNYEKKEQKDLEEYVLLTEQYCYVLRFKGNAQEAYKKLQEFDDQFTHIKPYYLNIVLLITNVYIKMLEFQQNEARKLFYERYDEFKSFQPKNNNEIDTMATFHHVHGMIFQLTDYENCIKENEKSILLRENLIKKGVDIQWQKRALGITLHNIANAYFVKGEINIALDYSKKHYEIAKEVNSLLYLAYAASGYGRNLLVLGKANEALDKFKEAYDYFKAIKVTNIAQFALNYLVSIYLLFGNYEKAYSYLEEMEQVIKTMDKSNESFLLPMKAFYYRKIGNFQQSIDAYENSLILIEKFGSADNIFKIRILLDEASVYFEIKNIEATRELAERVSFSLNLENLPLLSKFQLTLDFIELLIKLNDFDRADELFEKVSTLKNSFQDSDSVILQFKYDYVHALKIKNSYRLKDKLTAINMFKELINRNSFLYNDFMIKSIINVVDLLFLEYRSDPNKEIINEIKENLNKFTLIAEEQHNNAFKVESLILKSKLAIIEGDLNKALDLLDEGLSITDKNQMNFYQQKVLNEYNRIQNDISEQDFDKAEEIQRFNLSKMESYIKEIMNSNILDQTKPN